MASLDVYYDTAIAVMKPLLMPNNFCVDVS